MTAALHVETVGAGAPALLLLHGLGVNGAVWQRLLPHLADWPGRILIPDFRGHGRSPHGGPYAIGQHAADIGGLIEGEDDVHVVGHSMGGMVGLALASGWFGVHVAHVLAFGVKVSWTDVEIAKAKQVAAAPVRWFDTRDAAAERFLRVAGLDGLVAAEEAVVGAGLVEENGRWRLAADMATTLAAGTPIESALAAAGAPFRLACGERDPLVSIEQLRRYDAAAVVLQGCGHNPHVEQPAKLARLIPRP